MNEATVFAVVAVAVLPGYANWAMPFQIALDLIC